VQFVPPAPDGKGPVSVTGPFLLSEESTPAGDTDLATGGALPVEGVLDEAMPGIQHLPPSGSGPAAHPVCGRPAFGTAAFGTAA
jgi:hypothetical protein